MYKLSFLFFAFLFAVSCTPSKLVRPLKKKEFVAGAGLGGPLIKFGSAVIPIPFTGFYGGYGINDKLTATGGVHITPALFGVGEVEAGALINLWSKDSLRKGVSLHANMNFAGGNNAFRFWPQADLNYYFTAGKKLSVYTGVSMWFEPNRNVPHNEAQKEFVVPSFQAGILYPVKKWTLQAELKIIAAGHDNHYVVVDYVTPLGRQGAMGVYFTAARRFGK